MATANLNAARVRELLDYDPDTGLFRWRVDRRKTRAGSIAGCAYPSGYIRIKIDMRECLAHRLCWLYVTGAWPVGQIDHRDGDKANNRFANLRDVTRSVNAQNQRKAQANNQAGLLGVRRCHKRWRATIRIPGEPRQRHLGTFTSAQEAHAAYLEAKRRHHHGNTL
jgi:hypothetical protein